MGLSISINNSSKGVYAWWGLAGTILAGLFIFLFSISSAFDFTRTVLNKPIIPLVTVMVLSGLIYVAVVVHLRNTVFNKSLLVWIIAIVRKRAGMTFGANSIADRLRRRWGKPD